MNDYYFGPPPTNPGTFIGEIVLLDATIDGKPRAVMWQWDGTQWNGVMRL